MQAQGMWGQGSIDTRRVVSPASPTPHALSLFTRGNRWKTKWVKPRSLSQEGMEKRNVSWSCQQSNLDSSVMIFYIKLGKD